MKVNRAQVERVRKFVEKAEAYLAEDSRRLSAGDLWKGDVRAIRYLLDAFEKVNAK